jgi:hypothetical protein
MYSSKYFSKERTVEQVRTVPLLDLRGMVSARMFCGKIKLNLNKLEQVKK